LTRTLLVGIAVGLTIGIGEKLNKFLSIAGALTCSPIAFTFPALFHYKSCAETTKQKAIDISIVVISLVILVFCTALGIKSWGD